MALSMTSGPHLVFVAQVGSAFGVRGEFKLISHTEDPLSVLEYNPLLDEKGNPALSLTQARAHKGALIVRAEGVTDKDKADALKGLKLHVRREDLPDTEDEDDFYVTDLIGLEVRLPDGTKHGLIRNVEDFGAGDLLDIQPLTGASYYLGFTRDNVPEVDLAGGFVVITAPAED